MGVGGGGTLGVALMVIDVGVETLGAVGGIGALVTVIGAGGAAGGVTVVGVGVCL